MNDNGICIETNHAHKSYISQNKKKLLVLQCPRGAGLDDDPFWLRYTR